MPRPLSLVATMFAVVGIWLVGASSASAEEAPSTGLLYNTKEAHSLVYRCQQNLDNSLDCEFTQTAVRKKTKPDDLNFKLNQAREEFRAGVKMSADECKMYKDMNDVFEGRKKAPKEEGLKEITEMQKKDLLKMTKSMMEFCKSKTEENFLNFVRLGHEKDTRTCKVSANTYKQAFRFVQDHLSNAGAWVVQSTPEGPCGIVQLSRFEPERLKDSKLVFWKYLARKAITNPQGSFFPGASCKGLDEGEYVYDWRSKEHSLGCDYVEFTPL